jgi:hypothetical protein
MALFPRLFQAQEKRKVRESKQDALAEENAAKYQNADSALDTVVKANLSIKLLACLQVGSNAQQNFPSDFTSKAMRFFHFALTNIIISFSSYF